MTVDKHILHGAKMAIIGFLIQLAGSLIFSAADNYKWASFLLTEIRHDFNYAELIFWGSGIVKDILIAFGIISALHCVNLFISTKWGLLPVGILAISYFRLEWVWQSIDLIYLLFTDPHVTHDSKLKSLCFAMLVFIPFTLFSLKYYDTFKKYRL